MRTLAEFLLQIAGGDMVHKRLAILGLALTMAGPWALAARPIRPPVVVTQPATVAPANPTGEAEKPEDPKEPKEDPKELEEFIRGANLETDSEVQALIRRAREHLDEKRYREAVTVLQHIIDRPGNTLSTTDGRVYRSTRAVATEIVASLPKEGMEVYRLWADGEAKGLVGDVNKCVDVEALDAVVRRFFLSSLGDDAALRLASIALDRGEYGLARRLLMNILTVYPDASVDKSAVLARLALACARMNDKAGATAAWRQLEALNRGSAPVALAAVEKQMKSAESQRELLETDWLMAFGSAKRRGWRADLAAHLVSSTEKLWTTQWENAYSMDAAMGAMPGVPRGVAVNDPRYRGSKRDMLLGWWDDNKAVPSCQIATVGEHVFFKSVNTLICCDLRTGKRLWETPELVAQDPNPNPNAVYYGSQMLAEPQALLVDHLSRSLSVIDGRVYQIEENARADVPYYRNMIIVNGRQQPAPKPLQGNALSACDAASGRRLWRLGRHADEKQPFAAVRFLAPPTPCLGRLLVPVDENGELVLVALNPGDGSVSWRTFLCTYAMAKARNTRLVGVWVDGTEVMVSSGRGAIFAIDGADGSMLWASKYEPAQPKDTGNMAMFVGRYRGMSADGWQENYVTVEGGSVITAPADAEAVMAFDRRTGKLLFSKDVKDPRYCIGVANGSLLFVSADGVTRMELAKGDVVWKQKMNDIRGRAALAGEALYVPTGRKITRLDLKTGKRDVELSVKSPVEDPIGNLMIVGDRIIAAGVDRVASLVNAKALFDDLTAKIAAKPDAALLIERGRLHRDSGRTRDCIEDLKRAYGMLTGDARLNDVRADLVKAYLVMAKEQQAQMESFLQQAAPLAQTPGEKAAIAMTRAESLADQGKVLESAKAWRDVALAGGSDLLPSTKDATLSSAQWVSAAAALRDIAAKGGASKAELAGLGEATIAPILAGKSPREAVPAVRVFAGLGAVKSVREIATKLNAAGSIEVAEALLSDLADDQDARVAASAQAAIADLHQTLGWRVQARRDWERLASMYPGAAVAGFNGEPTGADLAKKRLAELGDAVVQRPRLGDPPWRIAWTVPGDALTVLRSESLDSPQLTSSIITQNARDGTISSYALADGKLQWQIKGGPPMVNQPMYYGAGASALNHQRNVGLIRNGRTLIGYSLLSGKALWEQKDLFADGVQAGVVYYGMNSGMALYGDMQMMAGSGVVVAKVSPWVVRVIDIATGATRWERTFNKAQVQQVNVRNGVVMVTTFAVQPNGMQLPKTIAFDRLTGQEVGQINWDNRMNYYNSAAIWTNWGCIHATMDVGASRIIGRAIPGGEAKWTVDWKSPQPPQMLEIHRDAAGQEILVAGGVSGIGVIDMAAGKMRWHMARQEMNAQLLSMTVDNGRLSCVQRVFRHDPKNPQDETKLVTYSLADGKVEREVEINKGARGLTVMAPVPAPGGDWLPIAKMEPYVAAKPGVAGVQRWTIMAIPLDPKKGATQNLPPPAGKDCVEMLRMPMTMAGDYLIVACRDGILAYTAGSEPKKGK